MIKSIVIGDVVIGVVISSYSLYLKYIAALKNRHIEFK